MDKVDYSVESETSFWSKPPLSPVDYGLRFAFARKKVLLSLAVFPMVIQMYHAYGHFVRPMSAGEVFVLIMANLAANAWLLAAVVMLCLEYVRGEDRPFPELAHRALLLLPKVFLSYLLLMSLLVVSLLQVPLFILVIFVIWAPVFCVCELYAASPKMEEEQGDGLFEDEQLFPGMSGAYDNSRVPQLFTGMRLWHLGFGRSMQFALRNLNLTAQLGVLLWFANVVPVALVDLVLRSDGSFFPMALKIAIPSFADVFVVCAAVAAFLLKLPVTAARELKLGSTAERFSQLELTGRFSLRLGGRRLPYVLMIALASLGSWVVYEQARDLRTMPGSVTMELREAVAEGGKFVLSFRGVDTKHSFRWLEPAAFRLQFRVDLEESPVFPELDQAADKGAGKDGSKGEMLQPESIQIRRDDGTEVAADSATPSEQPLHFRLVFPLPPAERGNFSLYYLDLGGESKMVMEGRFGDTF